jgi:hypothetical protein
VTLLNISGGGTVMSKYDYAGVRTEKSTSITTFFPFDGYQIASGIIV